MELAEKIELSEYVIKHFVEKYPRIFATCSFGKDSVVLLDLVTRVKPDVQFIGINTGYEFPETLDFAGRLLREKKFNFRWVEPSPEERDRIEKDYGDVLIKNSQYKCCAMKAPAIKPVLAEYNAWITGLRRDESELRKNTPLVEEGKIMKVNPLAFWTRNDIWNYIHRNKLSFHPLYNQGYNSLGCQPCTLKADSTKVERAGRFKYLGDNKQECGLHGGRQLL